MAETRGAHPPAHEAGLFARFLHSQVASTAALAAATGLALILANSPWGDRYRALAQVEIGLTFGPHAYHHTLAHWVQDGLMALFFFVVGLEIKREVVVGELSSVRRALLPVCAAVGGALLPAALYLAFNAGGPGARGWGIPMATDIAFALGLLSLFGRRVPLGLKLFLTALAIADDLLAVVVIALFYTAELHLAALAAAFALLAAIAAAGRLGLRWPPLYALLAFGVWAALDASGVHATLAGVLVALLVPVRSRMDPADFLATTRAALDALEGEPLTRESLNRRARQLAAVQRIDLAAEAVTPPGIALEKRLHGVQAYLVLPLFALFAAGVRLDAAALAAFPGREAAGILAGLLLGKPVGIVAGAWAATRAGARLPEGVGWRHLAATGVLAGIGFTMSIFIGDLAFTDAARIREAKLAILLASLAAGAAGALLLKRYLPRPQAA